MKIKDSFASNLLSFYNIFMTTSGAADAWIKRPSISPVKIFSTPLSWPEKLLWLDLGTSLVLDPCPDPCLGSALL